MNQAKDIASKVAAEMVSGQITTSEETAKRILEPMLYNHLEIIEAAGYVLITKEEYAALNK